MLKTLHTRVFYGVLSYIILCILGGNISAQEYNFNKITFDEGLSNNTVLSFHKDRSGFMWIGTRDGLNRFDGYRIKRYKSVVNDSSSLSTSNYINVIQENPYTNRLWIGTQDGINIYNAETDDFYRVKSPANWREKHFAVLSIHFDKNKVLLGTNRGVVFVGIAEKEFSYTAPIQMDCEVYSIVPYRNSYLLGTNKGVYLLKGTQSAKLLENTKNVVVRNINILSNSKIWLSTESKGILELDAELNTTTQYDQSNSLWSNSIRYTKTAADGMIWIATMRGLSIYSPTTRQFKHLQSDNFNTYSLNDNSIRTIYVDDQQTVWLGTNFGGVNYYHKENYNFQLDLADPRFEYAISGNLVSAVHAEGKDKLWVGTERDGLNIKNLSTGKFTRFPIKSHTVKSLFINDKYIFVGTFDSGLIRIDRDNYKKVEYFDTSGKNGIKLSQNYISTIAQDAKGNIWVGTGSAGIDIIESQFTRVVHINTKVTPQLSSDYIKAIVFDQYNQAWIGTGLGLNCMSISDGTFFTLDHVYPNITTFYINTLYRDGNGSLWVGTQEEGLYKMNLKSKIVEKIDLLPLPINTISSIVSNSVGNLIVTTNRGVVFYDVSTNQGILRSNLDGLPTNQYMTNAVAQVGDNLYLGSYKGLITFNEGNKQEQGIRMPKIILSGIAIANLDEAQTRELLQFRNLNTQDQIKLKHNQNNFTLYLGTDNFINPLKNTFAFRLRNKSSEWTTVQNGEIHFSGLSHGSYILEIKVSSANGTWNEDIREMELIITPPFYLSVWAYLFYSAIISLVIWQFFRYVLERQRLKTRLYYEAQNFKIQESAMRSKIDFFTKISHEIRTPLSLVSVPVEKVLLDEKLNGSHREQLHIAHKNIRRLTKIMDELLTFRKIDEKKFQLKMEHIDSIHFFEAIHEMFLPLAEEKDLDFKLSNTYGGVFLADRNYFEKVIINILSNAFKFSTDVSKGILLAITKSNNELVVSVFDDGMGIQKEHQQHIFDEFYQVSNNSQQGWGIGLHFCKEIMDSHAGDITVTSWSEELSNPYTTCFNIVLPLDDTLAHAVAEKESLTTSNYTSNFIVNQEKEDFHILIVEDNVELREFLVAHIGLHYKVLCASDGLEGLKLAQINLPDIIISDIAMPEMDGLEMVKSLKGQQDTSHIPIIFLTAKGDEEDMIQGYRVGVINYITKPFRLELLDMQLYNVLQTIKTNKALNYDFVLEAPVISPDTITYEQRYLSKLREEILSNLTNPEFSVQALASNMAQSQSSLLKKVKSLTGYSVKELITQIRLQRAAELLKNTSDIADIAYQVGYSDRKYFSKEFKKMFDINPSDYHRKSN